MRFVIQRVNRGCVKVSSQTVGQIGKGLMILVGISDKDTDEHIDHIVDKLLNIRLFDDDKGNRWKESVKSLGLELLLVSQFTLYHILKGNKPDFHGAMGGEQAKLLFEKIVNKAKEKYEEKKIQTGAFGEYMQIDMECDGPVTINWEYPNINKNDNNKEEKEVKKGGKKGKNKEENKEEKKDDKKENENNKEEKKENKRKKSPKKEHEDKKDEKENKKKKNNKKENKEENKEENNDEKKEEKKEHKKGKNIKKENNDEKKDEKEEKENKEEVKEDKKDDEGKDDKKED